MKRVFPLDWPEAQPHTRAMQSGLPANMKDTLTGSARRVGTAMNLPCFSGVELSTNVQVKATGLYVSEGVGAGVAPAAALKFSYGGRPYHIGQDQWSTVGPNVWSLALMCEGLRQVVRHAGDNLFERLISGGFAALPAPAPAARPWREVLGFKPGFDVGLGSMLMPEQLEAAVNDAWKKLHRITADEAEWLELNLARDAAVAEIKRG